VPCLLRCKLLGTVNWPHLADGDQAMPADEELFDIGKGEIADPRRGKIPPSRAGPVYIGDRRCQTIRLTTSGDDAGRSRLLHPYV
jgi:hypothetical protein